MLIQTATTDLIRVITSAAVTVDCHASWVDHTIATDNVEAGRTNTLITTATTTTVVAAPAASTTRNTKMLTVRNRHASTACDITVTFEQSGAVVHELVKATLLAGQTLQFTEGTGFYVIKSEAKLDKYLYVTADYVNATTSFTDITGLTCPVEASKHYSFVCHFFHFANATTSGPRFAINGPAMTLMRLGAIITESGGVAAAVMNGNVGDVTALETAVAATTDSTTTMVLSIMSGYMNPSAAGTFAVRGASEVAVAAGLTVKQGSFCHIWETPQG